MVNSIPYNRQYPIKASVQGGKMGVTSEITRREFLKVMGLLAGGVALGSTPFLAGCGYPTAPEIDADAYLLEGNTVTVMLEKVPQLSQVGGAAAIANDREKVHLIIARTGEDKFTVALNQCPHREKPLGYDHQAGHFICSSGKSEFKTDGSIVKGPAEQPLPIYKWHLEQGGLIIDLQDESSAVGDA
jgi:cytochrome b6-f complex iron-sulfur subunit